MWEDSEKTSIYGSESSFSQTICWHLDSGLQGFQDCEELISAAYKLTLSVVFCYNKPNRRRQLGTCLYKRILYLKTQSISNQYFIWQPDHNTRITFFFLFSWLSFRKMYLLILVLSRVFFIPHFVRCMHLYFFPFPLTVFLFFFMYL